MNSKSLNERIIFGLKVKSLRQAQELSFAQLRERTGMSVSYLNEIEKGKKFPKPEKLEALAAALGTTAQELCSEELDARLAPVGELLRSNFLNELPLDLFGIGLSKVAELIADAPSKVGAFISTLLELSRSYALREENFFFAALRAYLELHHNYFPEIEQAVDEFCQNYNLPDERPLHPELLARLLEDHYDYEILPGELDTYPELATLRSVFLPESRRLLLNSKLSPMQKAFQFGKELGFQKLELKERAYTSSILRGKKFEEVLSHAAATYFSVALHMPLASFVEDMKVFFAARQWSGEAFLQIMQRYDASPEMFYHRLTNVIPRYFGMPKLFFLRFVHDPERDHFEVDRELHLSKRHHPHGNALLEHYCRRWVSLSLLQDLADLQAEGKYVNTIVRAQRSRYYGTEDEYLILTLARPAYPAPNRNVSVSLGLLINEDVRKQINWLDDPAIQLREVNQTCERCPIADCKERASPPTIVQKKQTYQAIRERLEALAKEHRELAG
ncbi:MAG: XRE family transcriptional regulator [Bacteroidetes bacterium]|nr:MAG: XRE family transcriptional regulator [Bacteroidota bacterium]